MKLLILFFLATYSLQASEIYKQTTKESCIQQSAYQDKTLSEQKKIIVENAKQSSLEELYGTLIFSSTDIVDGRLASDEIKSRAVGSVRIKGDPSFYNGKNLGEICGKITSYITKKDLEKYSPKEVKLTRYCFNDTNVAMGDIQTKAREAAYKEMLVRYKPSLKSLSLKQAESLIHGFKESNAKFDFATKSYCFDAVGTILPYELEMGTFHANSGSSLYNLASFDENSLVSGMIATFYEDNDFKMKKPIYQTYVPSLQLEYKKLPLNDKIKKDKPYRIKITGYSKSNLAKNVALKMFANVYEAKLFINDNLIMTQNNNQNSLQLKKGFNKVKLELRTANSYDVKVVGGLEDIYTNKIQN